MIHLKHMKHMEFVPALKCHVNVGPHFSHK
jgi:hypothetical protein